MEHSIVKGKGKTNKFSVKALKMLKKTFLLISKLSLLFSTLFYIRREQGLEALYNAFERCVGVLSASSQVVHASNI